MARLPDLVSQNIYTMHYDPEQRCKDHCRALQIIIIDKDIEKKRTKYRALCNSDDDINLITETTVNFNPLFPIGKATDISRIA